MNHAITIGGMLLTIGVIGGLLAAAIGILMIFAAGMSDAGDDGTGGAGCITLAVGAVLVASCVFGLIR